MDAFATLRRHLDGPPRKDQAGFAKRVGLSQSAISQIRNEKRGAPVEAIPALNRELGTCFEDWARAAALVKRRRRQQRDAA